MSYQSSHWSNPSNSSSSILSRTFFRNVVFGCISLIIVLFIGNSFYPEFGRHYLGSDGLSGERLVSSDIKPVWYLGTMTAFHQSQRRSIIRATWQKLITPDIRLKIRMRFILSQPDSIWQSTIALEQETFGDLVILDLPETYESAVRGIKSTEYLRYVVQDDGGSYSFVSKLDDDSYLDAARFYRQYLEPLLQNSTELLAPGVPAVENAVIGRKMLKDAYPDYASGQFYTMSWDMANAYVQRQKEVNITNLWEDVLVGLLLHEHNPDNYFVTPVPKEEAFEFFKGHSVIVDGEPTAWMDQSEVLSNLFHAIGPGSMNAHSLKTDLDYLLVAECFDENGPRMPERVKQASALAKRRAFWG
jgi:hypothetical protein